MSNSRTLIPSPARSEGAQRTPRRYVTPRKTRSVCSPTRSTASGRLSTLIQEHREQDKSSFMLSPIVRRSLLPDDTDIDLPGRKSWWKNLNDQSRDVMEVLKENIIEPHNIMDDLNIEVWSQEAKKRYTLDLPDSSDCESIQSIVIPHKRLFDQKENRPQKQFDDFGNSRTSEKVFELNADREKPTTTGTKELFQSKPAAKPAFPAALLDVSANTTVGNKTLAPVVKPRTDLRNMFGTQQATKRKNMFAKFIESTTDYSSEEEIIDVSKVQRKFFDLPKPGPQRRTSARSSSSKLRDQSPTSNNMADSFADWDHLPSSTMVDNQIEAALTGGNKAKRSRLSKLSEASSPLTSNSSKSGNKSKQCNKSLKNKSQIKNKSLEKKLDIPQNTSLILKSKESKEIYISETHKNIQNTDNKIEKPIEISLTKKGHKSLLNEEVNNEMDVDEKQTQEQEFREIAEKNKNTIKSTLNKSLDKSNKKNDLSAISSKNNVIDLAMEKLDVIINQDVDMDVLMLKDDSINKQVEENLEIQYDNVSKILTKENDSEFNNLKIKEDFSQKHKKFEEEHITKNLEMDKTIDKLQTENNRINVEAVALNKNSKSKIQNESVNSNSDSNGAKEQSQNIDAMPNAMVNNEHHGENKEQTNEIQQNDTQKSQEECNDRQKIEEKYEAENNVSQEEITLCEENITEEQNESVIDSQDVENENSDQEAEKNESETEEQENDENKSEVEEQEVDKNESETREQAIDENESETEGHEVEDNESEIQEQDIDENKSEIKEQEDDKKVSKIEEEIVDENEVENEDQDNEDNNQEDASEVDEQKTTPGASNQSIEAMVDSEPENDQDSEQEQDQVNETNQESENEEVNESEPESNNEEEIINESDNEQSESESEAEQVNESDQEMENDQNDENAIDNTLTPDISHDTTGRNRKKSDNVSVEAVIFRPTKELEHSFVGRARNTTVRKSKSLINPYIEPEKIQENNSKGSLSMSEGRNSSAEGSGWDSHRTTRKTLRQTFGKDFTPRKSLHALVMEKSAKRHTLAKGSKDITTGNIPLANSTELVETSMGHDYEMQEESVESVHEVSIRTRKATLEEYLMKIKRENDEMRVKMAETVKKLLEQAPKEHTFKVPARPTFQRRTQGNGQAKLSTNKKLKLSVPLEDLPADVQEDLKYKPPKRFAPRNAAWLTKRFYKYVEGKLEPKYDYKARVRAEKFAQTLYNFVQANRRRKVALQDHVDELKHEMARLKIVKTHFEFYNFFCDFMPREVRVKVIPDLFNKIPQPRNGIFSDILVSDS